MPGPRKLDPPFRVDHVGSFLRPQELLKYWDSEPAHCVLRPLWTPRASHAVSAGSQAPIAQTATRKESANRIELLETAACFHRLLVLRIGTRTASGPRCRPRGLGDQDGHHPGAGSVVADLRRQPGRAAGAGGVGKQPHDADCGSQRGSGTGAGADRRRGKIASGIGHQLGLPLATQLHRVPDSQCRRSSAVDDLHVLHG